MVYQFVQVGIGCFLHLDAIYIFCDTTLLQVCRHLDLMPLILGGGIGQPDVGQVGEVGFLLVPILLFIKLLNQVLGPVQCAARKGFLGLFLQLPPLLILHKLTDEGHGFRAEDGIPAPQLQVLQVYGAAVIVDAVDLHAPALHRQLHADGDIVRCVPLLDDLIGRVRAVLRVLFCQHHADAVLHQLVQYRLPRQIAAGDSGGSQAVNVPRQEHGSQGGRSGLRVLAIEQQIITHPDADDPIRVLGF